MGNCCVASEGGVVVTEPASVVDTAKPAETPSVREARPEYKYDNGVIYTGEWLGSVRDGAGVQTWPEGTKYEGQFVNDRADGKGKFIHSNGDIYDGSWTADKPNGEGTYTQAD